MMIAIIGMYKLQNNNYLSVARDLVADKCGKGGIIKIGALRFSGKLFVQLSDRLYE